MMPLGPCREECALCGKFVSNAGFAKYQHRMKHVREGRMVKRPDGTIVRSLRDLIQAIDEGRESIDG